MKKRLLLQLLAVVCAVSAYAYNPGDYIFSPTAKFKVLGDNLVTNGTFDVGDGLENWTNLAGDTPSGDNWKVSVKLGPNGENVIESVAASADSVAHLTRSWELEAGTYTVSFWIRGNASGVTTVGVVNNSGVYTTPGDNYINYFVAVDGTASIETPILTGQNFNSEWKQIVGNVTLVEKKTVCFDAKAVESGVMLTNFEIYPVQQVFDTRLLERQLAYMQKLYADENFPNSKELMDEPMAAMQQMIELPGAADDIEMMQGLLVSVDEALSDFINANAGDTESGDWTTHASTGFNKINNAKIVGNWSTLGVRWGFSANDESLERPADDGYVLSAGIQRTFNLDNVGVKVTRTDLLPGKYFFKIEAQATAAANNASPYGSNSARPIVGPTIWIGTDSLTLENDTISGDYWKIYYRVAEVKEGETVNAGFLFPTYSDNMGGRYSLRNPEFRMIGKTTPEVKWELRVNDIIKQQTELKNRIDNYPIDVQSYYWGKDSLTNAITTAQPLYENSFTVVKADGSCDVPKTDEGVAQLSELRDSVLLVQVNQLGRAKNWIVAVNKIQDSLRVAIADANASLENAANANATASLRSALVKAVSDGQALIDALVEVNGIDAAKAKNVEFTNAKNTIRLARQEFEISTATRSNPAELQLVNPYFEDSFTRSGTQGVPSTATGWTLSSYQDMFDSSNRDSWAKSDSSYMKKGWIDNGYTLGVFRGSTVAPTGKARQTIIITQPGLYEYRAKAYAYDEKLPEFMATGGGTVLAYDEEADDDITVDSLYRPNVMLFFGKDGAPDSISVTKCIAHGKEYNNWAANRPLSYSVFYKKTTSTPEEVEFGIESFDNQATSGVNYWGFGDNQIFFVGDESQYVTEASKALDEEIAKAKTAIAAADASKAWIVWKIRRYLYDGSYPKIPASSSINNWFDAKNKPTDVKGIQNAYLSLLEMEALLDAEPTVVGIQSAVVENMTAPQGVYSLTGVKMGNDVNGLKPGLYIINGKKILVK